MKRKQGDKVPFVKKTVCVHGCYHIGNFGDQLLKNLLVKHINSTFDYDVDVLFDLDWPKGVIKKYTKFLFVLFGCNYFIFGGGGYLHDKKGDFRSSLRLLRYVVPALILQFRQIPYLILAPGVGPHLSVFGKLCVKLICRSAKHIYVRDAASKLLLAEIGVDALKVDETADLALTMSKASVNETELEKLEKFISKADNLTNVGLHISTSFENRWLIELISNFLIQRVDVQEKVQFWWFFDHGQANKEYISSLVSSTPNHSIVPLLDTESTAALISNFDVVLTTKLHVGIVAYSMGVTPYGISNHPKTKRFYQQVNLSSQQMDYEFSPELQDMNKLNSFLCAFSANFLNENSEQDSIQLDIAKKIRSVAYRNFDYVNDYLSDSV